MRMRPFLAALMLATTASAQIVNTVISNGPTQSHYDMVILGDGYQASEQTRFNQDVTTFLTGLFQKAPFTMLSGYFNVHTVFRASVDSGASHPDATPPITRNTAYSASYNTGGTARCLYINNQAQALADAALAPANESRILVMVNDSRYGGCASTFAVSYNGASMVEVQSHELGHAAASLADEYDYPNGNYAGGEPGQANISANSVGQKWSHWWGVENVSAFQGAGYYLTGLWRPRSDCLMRSLGVTLCPICREQIVKQVNTVFDAIGSPQPASTNLTLVRPATQAFSFSSLVPIAHNPTFSWLVDGVVVPGATGTSHTLATAGLSLGVHTVTARARDNTTVVRSDPGNAMLHTHTWTVQVTDASAANLRLVSASAMPYILPLGQEFDLAVTVVNDGPATATDVAIEHFLSSNGTLQTTDVFCGKTTIPALAAGQQQVITRRVRLPRWLTPAPSFLIGIVDRANATVESLENDNIAYTGMWLQPGDCGPSLDYRDDLLWPKDQGAIALATGGTLLPTVVSKCAPPGSLYLIAWGCSGTAPGTPLAPGLVLPLNVDSCTQTVLDNLNGGVFQAFMGVLDAQGVGRATLAVPPGLVIAPMATHFAAVTLDPTLVFTATTNAIGFDVQ